MGPSSSLADESADPRRSSFGRDYWLRRCHEFVVETPTRRIGRVGGVRYGPVSNEPDVLEVRAGFLGRRLLLISVKEITQIVSEEQRIVLNDPPQLLSDP